MTYHELERVELTNMCAIIDEKNKKVLVQERKKTWPGVAFPGGHVEKGEAIVSSTIREIKEETGLDIKNLKLCGIKDWFEPEKDRRYMVFLYATTEFSGKLIDETSEGKVFWHEINDLEQLNLASSFSEMAEMMLRCTYNEFIYEIKGSVWEKKFF